MPDVRVLTVEEFEKQPRERRLFDLWGAKTPLDTPIGAFEIVLNSPPDGELLGHANELTAALASQHDVILKLIYASYLRAAEDRYWMKNCGVPRNLEEDQILPHLRSRSISVWRDPKGRVSAGIFISPKWEVEHGIDIGVVKGRVVLQRI